MNSEKESLPSRDGPGPIPDPGRGWRRLARAGALVTVLAMLTKGDSLMPDFVSVLGYRWGILKAALYHTTPRRYFFDWFVGYEAGLVNTVPFVMAVVMSLLCGSRWGLPATKRALGAILMSFGVLITAGAGYMTFLHCLKDNPALLWIPHLALLLAALALLDGWHCRGSASCLFWPGTFLIVSACAAWGYLIIVYVGHFAEYLDSMFLSALLWNTRGVAMLGSAMVAAGWFLWWRALRRNPNPNP